MKIAIRADKYFNNKGKLDMIYGDSICPVDLNAGLVVEKTDKFGVCDGCTDTIQDNIRERFGLETPEGGESY